MQCTKGELLFALLQPHSLVGGMGAASQPSPAKREPRGPGENPIYVVTPPCIIY